MPTLSEILRTKLIPWSLQDPGERFIIARRKMRQADMPYGVQLVPHKIQGERVIIKDKRVYNNVRNTIANWPEAGLQELNKYVLICVLEGYVDYPVGNYKLQCGPGCFILIPPATPIPNGKQPYVDLEKSPFCDIVTFLLHPNILECWGSHVHAEGLERNNYYLVLHEHTVAFLRALTDENINDKRLQKILNVFFEVLLGEVEAGRVQKMREIFQVRHEASISPAADFGTHLEQYVQTNLRKHLTLKTAAAAMYFSPTHFSRIMRRETGKSFNEYLAEQRIAEAKELLRKTDYTITSVATLVGIKSHRYFRTFFKRHTGLTPTEFRSTTLKN